MLILRPALHQCRHQPRDVNILVNAPAAPPPPPPPPVSDSLPRSISDERHDEESSKLEPRRWRPKHEQLRNILPTRSLAACSRYSTQLLRTTAFTILARWSEEHRRQITLPAVWRDAQMSWMLRVVCSLYSSVCVRRTTVCCCCCYGCIEWG